MYDSLLALAGDFSTLDWIALGWLCVAWYGYAQLASRPAISGEAPRNLNQSMERIRRAWMQRMLERDNRITDASLIGHSVTSIAFFASTTMLIIAGLLGLLGNARAAYGVVGLWGFAVETSLRVFEIKILGLICIFVLAFLKFTWALRQQNYCTALIGAAPLPPIAPAIKERYADHVGRLLTLAITSFNGGIRAYYMALAWMAWFIHPVVFMAAVGFVLGVLVRRQKISRSYRAIQDYHDLHHDLGTDAN